MLSYEGQYSLAQSLASDSDSTNLALLKSFITIGQRRLESVLNINFTEETRTFTTKTDAISGTSNQSYKKPENFKKHTSLYVTVGSTRYEAQLIQDEQLWQQLNQSSVPTSDFLQFCFLRNDRVELYPIPSSTNTATWIYDAVSKPLVNDDYTDGTITTLANGGTAVTGSSTTFTSAMAGRYFRIDSDGEWYKIASFGTTTTLTLDIDYQGVSISSGSENYTIGQMPITPEDTHELPVYYAVWRWALMKKDVQLAREYERLWKEGVRDSEQNHANQSSSNITSGYRELKTGKVVNPNMFPENMS